MPILIPIVSSRKIESNETDISWLHLSSSDTIQEILNCPTLIARSAEFYKNSQFRANEADRVFFVQEGEIISGISEYDFDVIGTDDATTCHMLLMRTISDDFHSSWMVCHIDSEDRCESLNSYMTDLVQQSRDIKCNHIEVYVCGGLECDSTSDNISLSLFCALARTDIDCRIHLWSTSRLNTSWVIQDSQKLAFPRALGMAYVSSLEQVVPAIFPLHVRGPCPDIRSAIGFVNSFSEENHTQFRSIFLPSGGLCVLDISPLLDIPLEIVRIAYSLLGIKDDNEVLMLTSTSPHCEPDHFVAVRRAVSTLVVNIRTNPSVLNDIGYDGSNSVITFEYKTDSTSWVIQGK